LARSPERYLIMSKYIPVEPEKWAEMVKAQAEVKQLKEHIRYLEIELTTETARWQRAMEEVERLRKAGDAMAETLSNSISFKNNKTAEAWNAAKDGKPTE
jgi:predicted nuclease with TOPRIM domain